MKRSLKTLVASAALLLCSASSYAATIELDRIVAIVNDSAISLTSLNQEITSIKAQLLRQGSPIPPTAILEKQVLERLISLQLQLQLAKNNNIIVDEDSLNRAVNSIAEQNNLSLRQFMDVLQRDGYDYGKFREDIRNEIITTRLRQRQVDSRINISEVEIDQFLAHQQGNLAPNDEFRLGHILIAVPEAASAQQIQTAKAQAKAIHQRLAQGENFQELAQSASASQTALSGGDLGWRKVGQLPTLFANLVPKMSVGDVSQPIRSPSGFHIIKLLEHKGGERHMITQHHARHILIQPNELLTVDEVKHRLREMKERVESGADFAELAKANSADKTSAINGGDLGWASPGQMVATFENIMNSIAINAVSEPFETQFGWHILQVTERREHDNTDAFKRDSARQQLVERKIAEEQELWLRRLREEAYVEIRLEQDPVL